MSTIEELISAVQRPDETPVVIELTGDKEGKVILIIGAGNGVGARTTTTYMAQVLADSGLRLLHIDMNITAPGIENFYFPDTTKIQMNLDRVYQIAKKGSITGQDIEKNAVASKRNPNIFFIPGTRNHLVADEFDDRVLQAIIKASRQHFNIVLINANADLDNAGTVASLLESDQIIIGSSGDSAEIRLLNERLNLFRAQMPSIFTKMSVILIERDQSFKLAETQVKTTDLTYLGKIPYLLNALNIKNTGGILRGKDAEQYLKSIEQVTKKLGIYSSFNDESKQERRVSFINQIKTLLQGKGA